MSDASDSEVLVLSAAKQLKHLFGVCIVHVRTHAQLGFGGAVNLVWRRYVGVHTHIYTHTCVAQGNRIATGRYRAILNNDAYVAQVALPASTIQM